MTEYAEPDFGVVHGKFCLVIDGDGMVYAAHYADGAWWEGSPDGPRCRVQLPTVPVALYDPRVSA